MDVEKIGQYLSSLRHEHNLTQEQLGVKLGVTNKTVSRWETGKYLPPVEALQQLSELYEITINEILSGQKLNQEEYKKKAEENIKSVLEVSTFTLQDKIGFYKQKWKKEHIFEMVLGIILFVAILIIGFILDNGIQVFALILGFLWSIAKYNEMMQYVEGHAYHANKK